MHRCPARIIPSPPQVIAPARAWPVGCYQPLGHKHVSNATTGRTRSAHPKAGVAALLWDGSGNVRGRLGRGSAPLEASYAIERHLPRREGCSLAGGAGQGIDELFRVVRWKSATPFMRPLTSAGLAPTCESRSCTSRKGQADGRDSTGTSHRSPPDGTLARCPLEPLVEFREGDRAASMVVTRRGPGRQHPTRARCHRLRPLLRSAVRQRRRDVVRGV